MKLPFEQSLSTLVDCEVMNVELVSLLTSGSSLLTSGSKKVDNQHYDQANNMLKQFFI